MDELKGKIAETIYVPDYLRKWKCDNEIKDLATTILFEMLDCYFNGVQFGFISNRRVKSLCYKIDKLSYDFSQVSDPDIYLQNWLFIGTTVELWIEFAVDLEEFEVAANLRKLLNSEYA
jgi:hypothetical protein